MKLNRLILASLIGISLSTPAWACDPGKGGLFSFFHHTDSDHDKDHDKDHHDHDGDKDSHHDCSGGSSSGGSSSSGSSTTTTPAK